MSHNFKIFMGDEDKKEALELKEKIQQQINGYTINQIREAFRLIESGITICYLINLSDQETRKIEYL